MTLSTAKKLIRQFGQVLVEREKELAHEKKVDRLVKSESAKVRILAARQLRRVRSLTKKRERERRQQASQAVQATLRTNATDVTEDADLEFLTQPSLGATLTVPPEVTRDTIETAVTEGQLIEDYPRAPLFSRTQGRRPSLRQLAAARSNFFKISLSSDKSEERSWEDSIPWLVKEWHSLGEEQKAKFIPPDIVNEDPVLEKREARKNRKPGSPMEKVRLYIFSNRMLRKRNHEDRYYLPITADHASPDPLRTKSSSCEVARPAFLHFVTNCIDENAAKVIARERERKGDPTAHISHAYVVEKAVKAMYNQWLHEAEVRRILAKAGRANLTADEQSFERSYNRCRSALDDYVKPKDHIALSSRAKGSALPHHSPIYRADRKRRSGKPIAQSVPTATASPESEEEIEIVEAVHTALM